MMWIKTWNFSLQTCQRTCLMSMLHIISEHGEIVIREAEILV